MTPVFKHFTYNNANNRQSTVNGPQLIEINFIQYYQWVLV